MMQIVQHQRTGRLSLEELPSPQIRPGSILVCNQASLISSGTERTSIATARASLIGKAKSRPDLVKQVIDNAKRDGIVATYRKVQSRLMNYKELGYSSAGIVLESSISEFRPGDRVACAGDAHHAEVIVVPKHLAVALPSGVTFEEGAFTTLGAIAMQGVRQATVQLGETVAVIGLGLLGLITVQLLKANGCRVIGLDISSNNFELARHLGSDLCVYSDNEAMGPIREFTNGYGVDSIIITASSASNQPMEMACQIAHKRSKIVVVGAVGMKVPRPSFYEKELTVTIACSYGPGRYDASYEYQGVDYPLGYVRWTENRNMGAVVDLIARHSLNVRPLITHQFPISRGLDAYDLITSKKHIQHVGVILNYPPFESASLIETHAKRIILAPRSEVKAVSSKVTIGFIGAGHFAQAILLPVLKRLDVPLLGVATANPINARSVAATYGFAYCATDPREILNDSNTSAVFIATRHDSHAQLVIDALNHGKHVFVEKPLAVGHEQLAEIAATHKSRSNDELVLMAGFNRRFSKPFRDIRSFFSTTATPLAISYRVNAGELAPNHWIYEPGQGGRIVGETCHFIDCMTYLTNATPIRVFAEAPAPTSTLPGAKDSVSVIIRFSDGSIGHLLYVTSGDPSMGKEYCEVSGGGGTALMNNFREIVLCRSGKRRRISYGGGKGHLEEIEHFVAAAAGRVRPSLSLQSILDASYATLAIEESLHRGGPIDL